MSERSIAPALLFVALLAACATAPAQRSDADLDPLTTSAEGTPVVGGLAEVAPLLPDQTRLLMRFTPRRLGELRKRLERYFGEFSGEPAGALAPDAGARWVRAMTLHGSGVPWFDDAADGELPELTALADHRPVVVARATTGAERFLRHARLAIPYRDPSITPSFRHVRTLLPSARPTTLRDEIRSWCETEAADGCPHLAKLSVDGNYVVMDVAPGDWPRRAADALRGLLDGETKNSTTSPRSFPSRKTPALRRFFATPRAGAIYQRTGDAVVLRAVSRAVEGQRDASVERIFYQAMWTMQQHAGRGGGELEDWLMTIGAPEAGESDDGDTDNGAENGTGVVVGGRATLTARGLGRFRDDGGQGRGEGPPKLPEVVLPASVEPNLTAEWAPGFKYTLDEMPLPPLAELLMAEEDSDGEPRSGALQRALSFSSHSAIERFDAELMGLQSPLGTLAAFRRAPSTGDEPEARASLHLPMVARAALDIGFNPSGGGLKMGGGLVWTTYGLDAPLHPELRKSAEFVTKFMGRGASRPSVKDERFEVRRDESPAAPAEVRMAFSGTAEGTFDELTPLFDTTPVSKTGNEAAGKTDSNQDSRARPVLRARADLNAIFDGLDAAVSDSNAVWFLQAMREFGTVTVRADRRGVELAGRLHLGGDTEMAMEWAGGDVEPLEARRSEAAAEAQRCRREFSLVSAHLVDWLHGWRYSALTGDRFPVVTERPWRAEARWEDLMGVARRCMRRRPGPAGAPGMRMRAMVGRWNAWAAERFFGAGYFDLAARAAGAACDLGHRRACREMESWEGAAAIESLPRAGQRLFLDHRVDGPVTAMGPEQVYLNRRYVGEATTFDTPPFGVEPGRSHPARTSLMGALSALSPAIEDGAPVDTRELNLDVAVDRRTPVGRVFNLMDALPEAGGSGFRNRPTETQVDLLLDGGVGKRAHVLIDGNIGWLRSRGGLAGRRTVFRVPAGLRDQDLSDELTLVLRVRHNGIDVWDDTGRIEPVEGCPAQGPTVCVEDAEGLQAMLEALHEGEPGTENVVPADVVPWSSRAVDALMERAADAYRVDAVGRDIIAPEQPENSKEGVRLRLAPDVDLPTGLVIRLVGRLRAIDGVDDVVFARPHGTQSLAGAEEAKEGKQPKSDGAPGSETPGLSAERDRPPYRYVAPSTVRRIRKIHTVRVRGPDGRFDSSAVAGYRMLGMGMRAVDFPVDERFPALGAPADEARVTGVVIVDPTRFYGRRMLRTVRRLADAEAFGEHVRWVLVPVASQPGANPVVRLMYAAARHDRTADLLEAVLAAEPGRFNDPDFEAVADALEAREGFDAGSVNELAKLEKAAKSADIKALMAEIRAKLEELAVHNTPRMYINGLELFGAEPAPRIQGLVVRQLAAAEAMLAETPDLKPDELYRRLIDQNRRRLDKPSE